MRVYHNFYFYYVIARHGIQDESCSTKEPSTSNTEQNTSLTRVHKSRAALTLTRPNRRFNTRVKLEKCHRAYRDS